MTRLSGTQLLKKPSGSGGASGMALPAALWLESPYLSRAARRVAIRYSLQDEDVADLLQELRIVLLQTHPERSLNATWIFQTASHKAADVARHRMRSSAGEIHAFVPSTAEPSGELLHLLRAKAALLPPKLKAFYDLRYGQGLSQRDIARQLGTCRASVRWLERQCIRVIRGGLCRFDGPA